MLDDDDDDDKQMGFNNLLEIVYPRFFKVYKLYQASFTY